MTQKHAVKLHKDAETESKDLEKKTVKLCKNAGDTRPLSTYMSTCAYLSARVFTRMVQSQASTS
jgi:hypothetical protein